MIEIVKSYIGKECLIYTINSQVTGVVKEVSDNWLSVETGENINAINLEYVLRIREYPKNKKGKKKSYIFD